MNLNNRSKPTHVEDVCRHLDLGCGNKPRNPYMHPQVFGVDISANTTISGVEIRQANLSVDAIPFQDSYFSSVSAYDFLEHIPRILNTRDGLGTRFPFVELMNEIWRVLMPGGLFYGQTPAYPHPAVFQDPTHVNILTSQSHIYFTRPELLGRMYGYHGDFEVVRVIKVSPEFEFEPVNPNWRRRRKLRKRERRGDLSHLIWEFRAIK